MCTSYCHYSFLFFGIKYCCEGECMPCLFCYYHESDKGSVFKLTPGLCSLVDYEPLNLPGTCSCLHIAFLIAFWLMVPVIFFFGTFFFCTFGLGLLFYKIHIFYFFSFACCLS